MRRIAVAVLLAGWACASRTAIERVRAYRAAVDRGDETAIARDLAPNARIWYEKKEGPGDPLTTGGGSWKHWDSFFHSRSRLGGWRSEGTRVSAVVHETNDFYALLDWTPAPYSMTWWLDREGRVAEVLVESIPGAKATSRFDDFKRWAYEKHPDEMKDLLPNGKIDPTGDRAERWVPLLREWRREAGLPPK